MRWTMTLVVIAALGGAIGGSGGCGSKTPGGGGEVDAQVDAAPGGIDAARTDAALGNAVACGTLQASVSCPLPAQACCDLPPGTAADYCFDVPGGLCDGGTTMKCDGPEDCKQGERCCLKAGTGSVCTAGPDCAPGGSGGQIMCHPGDNSPCAPNGICCDLNGIGPSGASPYGACRVGACPA